MNSGFGGKIVKINKNTLNYEIMSMEENLARGEWAAIFLRLPFWVFRVMLSFYCDS